MLKMMLLHTNLATNARVAFKICSLLIIMHQKADTHMDILNHIFNPD